jgi:O-antigen/teichoic acid export membrane protein
VSASNPINTRSPLTSVTAELPTESSAILRIFGRNTLWLWIDLGALRIGTMLAGLFLIRYFGPVNFGIYSTALAVGWLANAVIDLGLTRYAARATAANIHETRPILSLTLLTTVGSALATIAVLLVVLRTGYFSLACIAAGFILCNFEGTSSLCGSILTGDLRSKEILPGSILSACGLILMTILTLWLRLSVWWLLIGLCFKSFFVMCLRLWQLRSYWPGTSEWTLYAFKKVARSAFPFFANNLTQVGYGKIAILGLGAVSSQAEVGWFAAAYTIADVVPQWSYALSGALLPVWTKLFEAGRTGEMLALRRRVLDGILCVTIPIWVGLALFAKPLCQFLGTSYVPSAAVLSIIAIRCVLTVLDGFFGHGFLVAANRVGERQKALAECLLLLGLLSFAFGHRWGAVGVAAALVISDSWLIFHYLRICSRIGLRIEWPALLPIAAAAVLMICSAAVVPAQTPFFLRVLAAIGAYACTLFALSRGQVVNLFETLRACIAGTPDYKADVVASE